MTLRQTATWNYSSSYSKPDDSSYASASSNIHVFGTYEIKNAYQPVTITVEDGGVLKLDSASFRAITVKSGGTVQVLSDSSAKETDTYFTVEPPRSWRSG